MMNVVPLVVAIAAAAALGVILFSPLLKGFRTRTLGWLLTIGGGLLPLAGQVMDFLQGLDWTQYLDQAHAPWAVLIIGIAVLILREMTTTPAGKA